MVFGNYSEFYDVFYHGKDYEGEASFLETLWREKALPPTSVLDLGCGTGGHLFSLVEKGYQVVGVDLSATMLMEARHKLMECKKSVYLIQGDMRDIRLERTFDVVISMFAVMGYQRDNQDFLDALRTARAHLEISGWFIFDAWYGPAVLRILPETRYREFRLQDGSRVLRIADPDIHYETNTVTVNYHVLHLKNGCCLSEVRESHHMRYFFMPEVEFFARQAGFRVVHTCAFMEPERFPGEHDWNVTWVLEAV